MNFLIRFIVGMIMFCAGIILVAKSYGVVQKVGRNDWAEQHLGSGGTYLLVKLFGIFLITIAILFILNVLNPFALLTGLTKLMK